MSSLGTSKGILEIGKFAVYVTVPIGLMYFFASNQKNLQKVMGNSVASLSALVSKLIFWNINELTFVAKFLELRQYVVYPPEGPRPPSPEELREMAREIARKREKN